MLFNTLSRLVVTFLPRSKHLLISWLKSPAAVILEPKKIKPVTVSPSICHEVTGPDAMIFSQFSRSVVSDSLRPHESQHARPPCPSPTPGVHSDSRPTSQWCNPAISSSVIPFSSCPKSLPAWVFSNESTLRMRWPKYWSFSFSIIPSMI